MSDQGTIRSLTETTTHPVLLSTMEWLKRHYLLLLTLGFGIFLRLLFFSGYQGADDRNYIVYAYLFSQGKAGVEHATAWIGRIGFWLPLAFSIRLFGASEGALVLYPFLCSVGNLILIYRLGLFLYDERIALLATFFLSFFPLDVLFATHVYGDIPLAFFMVLALFLFLLGEGGRSKWYYLGAGLAVGVAYLIKEEAGFIVVPFAVYILWRRTLKVEYVLALAGIVFFLMCEFAFWKLVADDPLHRYHALSTRHKEVIMYRSHSQPLFLPQPLEFQREGNAFLEPLWIFTTNQEFGFFYYFILPLLFYFIGKRDQPTAVLRIWIFALILCVCFFPVSLSPYYTLMRDERRFASISIPVLLILAYGCMKINPLWRQGLTVFLLLTSLFCLYADGSRFMMHNERNLHTFYRAHPDEDFWADSGDCVHIFVLSRFDAHPHLKMHLLTGTDVSDRFRNLKLLCPNISMARRPAEIRSGYVALHVKDDDPEWLAQRVLPSWQLVRRISAARGGTVISMLQMARVPQRYIDFLLPSHGETLHIYRVQDADAHVAAPPGNRIASGNSRSPLKDESPAAVSSQRGG